MHKKDHPGRETRVIPCVVVGTPLRTRCVCVYFRRHVQKHSNTSVEFLATSLL